MHQCQATASGIQHCLSVSQKRRCLAAVACHSPRRRWHTAITLLRSACAWYTALFTWVMQRMVHSVHLVHIGDSGRGRLLCLARGQVLSGAHTHSAPPSCYCRNRGAVHLLRRPHALSHRSGYLIEHRDAIVHVPVITVGCCQRGVFAVYVEFEFKRRMGIEHCARQLCWCQNEHVGLH